MFLVGLAALAQSHSWDPIPGAEQPSFVTAATAAVAAGRPETLESSFSRISVVDDKGTRAITGAAALGLLSGCQQGDVRRLRDTTFTVDYVCLARRASAVGCDSGDLFLIVRGDPEKTLAIASSRKTSADCLPPVPPPPPPPVDLAVASKFARALVSNDQVVLRDMVNDGTFVTTAQRFPGSEDVTRIGEGKGLDALNDQYSGLVQKLGQPYQVECVDRKLFAFCRFQLRESGRILMGFLNTKGPGMYMIRFDYVVR